MWTQTAPLPGAKIAVPSDTTLFASLSRANELTDKLDFI